MKTFRRVCIGLVLLGLGLLAGRSDRPPFPTVPFPGAGLTVKIIADVVTEGDYRIDVSMPKANQTIGEAPDPVSCSLVVNLAGQTKEISSLPWCAEYGFAKIQYFESNEVWHLGPGRYTAEISSRQSCAEAASRGAALTIDQVMTRPTERYILWQLQTWSGGFFLIAGMLGLLICEYKNA